MGGLVLEWEGPLGGALHDTLEQWTCQVFAPMEQQWHATGSSCCGDVGCHHHYYSRRKLAASIQIHHHHCYYYSARKPILILLSDEGWKAEST